jgi:hypothetical protein
MPRYLIELTHDDEHDACVRALHAVQQYGSHLVTHMEWGCRDGVHSGWSMGECEDRNEALQMVPPEMRQDARIVEIDKFTPAEIIEWLAALED